VKIWLWQTDRQKIWMVLLKNSAKAMEISIDFHEKMEKYCLLL